MSFDKSKDIDKQIKDAVIKKLQKAFSRGFNTEYADELRERIIKRTRLGVGVDSEGNGYRLPKLSEDYKLQRQGKINWYTLEDGRKIRVTNSEKRKVRLHKDTTPAKSNLTATGQLLNAITAVKIKFKGGARYVFRIGDRRGLGLFGYKSNIGNKELAKIQAENYNRGFFGFTKAQIREIKRDVKSFIKKYI